MLPGVTSTSGLCNWRHLAQVTCGSLRVQERIQVGVKPGTMPQCLLHSGHTGGLSGTGLRGLETFPRCFLGPSLKITHLTRPCRLEFAVLSRPAHLPAPGACTGRTPQASAGTRALKGAKGHADWLKLVIHCHSQPILGLCRSKVLSLR